MHVDVGRAGAHRAHELVELAGGDALARRGADVGRRDRAGDRAAGGGARLRAGRAVAEVRAQEHDDRPVVGGVLEVDVRLRRGRLEVAERQLVVDLLGRCGRPRAERRLRRASRVPAPPRSR